MDAVSCALRVSGSISCQRHCALYLMSSFINSAVTPFFHVCAFATVKTVSPEPARAEALSEMVLLHICVASVPNLILRLPWCISRKRRLGGTTWPKFLTLEREGLGDQEKSVHHQWWEVEPRCLLYRRTMSASDREKCSRTWVKFSPQPWLHPEPTSGLFRRRVFVV
jgi:hypothetical protein